MKTGKGSFGSFEDVEFGMGCERCADAFSTVWESDIDCQT